MKITNENNIPLPIYRAICQNWYGGKGYKHFCSITSLLKGTKQFVLESRHSDEIETEASEQVWQLLGSAMHAVLEKAEAENTLVEERLETEIDGKIVSGGIDHYENGTITDFKFTSIYTWIFGSRIKEWTKQLNAYAYLYKKAGFPVHKLQIICIFRDWSKSKYRNKRWDEKYPKQIEIIDLELWKDSLTEEFIREKLIEFEAGLDLPDDMIDPCSYEERWEEEPQYALCKNGAIRATKLYPTPQDAETALQALANKDQYHIEPRLKEPKKCNEYCSVNKFCSYYKTRLLEGTPMGDAA